MNSFTLSAIGNVARDPERGTQGEGSSTRSCLVGNHAAGGDAQGNALETVTSAWFVVFGKLGEILAGSAGTGHQLVVPIQRRSSTCAGRDDKRPHQLSLVTRQLRLRAPGRATRQQLANRQGQPLAAPF